MWTSRPARRCQKQIHGGPGRSHPHHVAAWVAQRGKPDWNGLGVPEKKGGMREQQECRQQDRPKRIDVLQRIEAHASKTPCRIVAEPASDKPMRRFMERDCENGRNDPGRCCVEKSLVHLVNCLRLPILEPLLHVELFSLIKGSSALDYHANGTNGYQRTTVSGCTIVMVFRCDGNSRHSQTNRNRSAAVNRGLEGACRRSTFS
jgi:hypothetical protein